MVVTYNLTTSYKKNTHLHNNFRVIKFRTTNHFHRVVPTCNCPPRGFSPLSEQHVNEAGDKRKYSKPLITILAKTLTKTTQKLAFTTFLSDCSSCLPSGPSKKLKESTSLHTILHRSFSPSLPLYYMHI